MSRRGCLSGSEDEHGGTAWVLDAARTYSTSAGTLPAGQEEVNVATLTTDLPATPRVPGTVRSSWRRLTQDEDVPGLVAQFALAQTDAAQAQASLDGLVSRCRPVAEEIARTYVSREEDLAARLPAGYATVLGPDVGGVDLSGGQWQRVALVRAFFRETPALVPDEPTAALDPLAELTIFTRFLELARDRTHLLISHRLGMARLADQV